MKKCVDKGEYLVYYIITKTYKEWKYEFIFSRERCGIERNGIGR